MKKKIEFYFNGKLYKTCSYEKWDVTEDYIKAVIYKGGYKEVYINSTSYNTIPSNSIVYINPSKYKMLLFSWKIFSGFFDKNGNKIYDGDKVITPFGFESYVHQHWGNDVYYVRKENLGGCWSWKDYDIDDFKRYEKIKDVNDTPKSNWNNIEKVTLKSI